MKDSADEHVPSPEIVCHVILTEWLGGSKRSFDIRSFRNEMEKHYRAAGLDVPAELADPNRLVPTRRLLEARSDLVSPADPAGVTWAFISDGVEGESAQIDTQDDATD